MRRVNIFKIYGIDRDFYNWKLHNILSCSIRIIIIIIYHSVRTTSEIFVKQNKLPWALYIHGMGSWYTGNVVFFIAQSSQTPPKRSPNPVIIIYTKRMYLLKKKKNTEPTHIPLFQTCLEITCSRENEWFFFIHPDITKTNVLRSHKTVRAIFFSTNKCFIIIIIIFFYFRQTFYAKIMSVG